MLTVGQTNYCVCVQFSLSICICVYLTRLPVSVYLTAYLSLCNLCHERFDVLLLQCIIHCMLFQDRPTLMGEAKGLVYASSEATMMTLMASVEEKWGRKYPQFVEHLSGLYIRPPCRVGALHAGVATGARPQHE